MSDDPNTSSHGGQRLFNKIKTLFTGNTVKLIGRETWNSFRIILILLILFGVIYPLIVFGVGQLAFNKQANAAFAAPRKGQIGHHWHWTSRDHPECGPLSFHGIDRCTVCNDSSSTLVL